MQQVSTEAPGGPSLDKAGLCLLSLDGGGIRGLSTLLILKRLMDRTNTERIELGLGPVKPWQLFDLIGGTSTGGLIAIMLGRLKMDVSECIKVYTNTFEMVFEKQKHKYPVNLRENFGYLQNKFDSDILRESIKTIVKDQGLSETEKLNSEGERSCRVFVCATAFETTTPVCLRDYDLVDEPNDDNATIVEAALATSAATTFFEPVTIGGRRYVDGALGQNNPIRFVWAEAQNIWCPEDGRLESRVKCLVSIGTGNPGLTSVGEGVKGFVRTLKDIAKETENTTAQSLSQHRGLLDQRRYFRYNVDQGLQDVGLEEYRKQPLIESATRTYLANELQKRSFRDCAKNLGMKQSSTPINSDQFLIIGAKDPPTSKVASTHFRVPAPSSEKLIGREDIMLQLENMMAGSDKHTRVVLWGFSGIGKTRIAREFAYKWKDSSAMSVFWVHAGSRQRVGKDYLDIAKEVGMPGCEDPEFDQLVQVKEWFERKTRGRWILILDNADDIDMLYGASSRLADCFPRSSNGTILLTTRNRKVGVKFTGSDQSLIHVECLSDAESVRLLKAKIISDLSEEHYTHLAAALHNIPLALVQAAAYILTERSSISEYLRMYDRSDAAKIQLLEDEFEDDLRDNDTQNAIAQTLVISLEQLKKSDRLAAEILSFMSMLDPQAIPRSLLPGDEDPVTLAKALATLQAFSLISKSSRQGEEDEYYDLHRLVRLVMCGYLRRKNELNTFMRKATLVMLERFPCELFYANREICRTYFPHLGAILSFLRKLNGSVSSQVVRSSSPAQMEMESDLLSRATDYFSHMGDYASGQSMTERSLAIREKVLGPEDQKTLTCANKMLWLLNAQGNTREAIPLGQTTLRRAKRALGQDHETTLSTMRLLGLSLTGQRVDGEAEQILEKAVQAAQIKFGEKHALTLTSMDTLSLNLIDQGKLGEAEPIMRKTLHRQKRMYGEHDRRTMVSMSHLAKCLSRQGNDDEAEEMARSVLQIGKIVLGDEHLDTLRAMSNLAECLGKQGNHEEAEQMAREALRLAEKVFGQEDPRTINTMAFLSEFLNGLDKHEEAEQMARETLPLAEKVLGQEHHHTFYATNLLINVLNGQGKHEEAEKMARKALPLAEKVLGQKHPNTIQIMAVLVDALNAQGKYEEARITEQPFEESEERPHKPKIRFPRDADSRGGVLSRLFRSKTKDRGF